VGINPGTYSENSGFKARLSWGFRGFPHYFQMTAEITLQITPRPLRDLYFITHYSLIFQSYKSESMHASLNRLQI